MYSVHVGCAVLLCLACLTLLAFFFLPSHLSFSIGNLRHETKAAAPHGPAGRGGDRGQGSSAVHIDRKASYSLH